MIELLNKDCFEVMAGMKDHSIDCIITDPPYGSTELDFDRVKLDAEKMISEFQRLIKPNRAVVIFANLRFATRIINANKKFFRYEWVWKKSMKVGFLDCNNRPLKQHEYILIFGNGKPLYRPQMQPGKPYIKIRKMTEKAEHYGKHRRDTKVYDGGRFPTSVLSVPNPNFKSIHHTKKPTSLIEYLIKTYSNKNEMIFDPFMGSGTTGIACLENDRDFLGCEIDADCFSKAQALINEEQIHLSELIPLQFEEND